MGLFWGSLFCSIDLRLFLCQCQVVVSFKFLFIYLFLAVLSLHRCTGFSLVVESWDHSLAAVPRLLVVGVSLVVEHGLQGGQGSVVVTCGLSSCGF